MKKYLILVPIIGIFAPSFIKDWSKFVEKKLLFIFNIFVGAYFINSFYFYFYSGIKLKTTEIH